MALPAGLRALFNMKGPKGDKGDKGDTGTFASASARSVAADQPAVARVSGPWWARVVEFDIPRGQPGVNAVPADEAIATYLAAVESRSRAAADALIASWAAKNTIYATDHGIKENATTQGAFTQGILQGLINLISATGGGVLELPKGQIWYDSPLVPKNNVAIVGKGKGATKLMCLQSAFYGAHTEADPLRGFHLRGFTASGERFGDTVTWKGYHDQYHIDCSWVDVAFDDWGMTGLGPDYLQQCLFLNCSTFNTGRANDGTQPSGNGIGIATGGFGGKTENFTMIGCHAVQAKRFGIMIEGGPKNGGGKELASAMIIGNSAGKCGNAGFLLGGSRHSTCIGNYAYDNVGDGILFGTGTIIQSAPSWRSTVLGNQCHNNGGAGIAYDTVGHAVLGPGAIIEANNCTGNAHGIAIRLGLSDATGVSVQNNYIEANTFAGILLELGTRTLVLVHVSGNELINNWAAAATGEDGQIVIRGGTVDAGQFADNTFRHNSAARVSVRFGTASAPSVSINKTAFKVNHSATNPLITIGNVTFTPGNLVVMGNEGANVGTAAIAAANIGASPWTYTAGTTPEYLHLRAGTVTGVTKNGVAVFAGLGQHYLLPGQSVTVSYTGTLVATADRVQ
ncbi:right-handed parallel beta-helix repeat-containing protein [Microbacterium saperdae]